MATENGFFTNQTQFQNDPNVSQRDNLKGFYGTAVRPAYIEDLVAKAEEAAAKSYEYSQDSKLYRDEAEIIRDQTQVINDQTDQVYLDTVQVYNDTVMQANNAANTAVAASDSAQVSATNASNSESAAATSEANALASENAAATSASNAATSESNAATSASNAATSEANAAQSASDAQQSADDAAAIVPLLQSQIDDRVTYPELTTAQGDNLGGKLFKGSNGETVEVGDIVEPGTTHLRVLVNGSTKLVTMDVVSSGVVSNLTDWTATIGGTSVYFIPAANPNDPVSWGADPTGTIDSTNAFRRMSDALVPPIKHSGTFRIDDILTSPISVVDGFDMSGAKVICSAVDSEAEGFNRSSYIFAIEQGYIDVTSDFTVSEFVKGATKLTNPQGYEGHLFFNSNTVQMLRNDNGNLSDVFRREPNVITSSGQLMFPMYLVFFTVGATVSLKRFNENREYKFPDFEITGAIRSPVRTARNNSKVTLGVITQSQENAIHSPHETWDASLVELTEYTRLKSGNLASPRIVGYPALHFNSCLITYDSITASDVSGWGGIDGNYSRGILVKNSHVTKVSGHAFCSDIKVVNSTIYDQAAIHGYGKYEVISNKISFRGEGFKALVQTREDYMSSWDGEIIIKDCDWDVIGSLDESRIVQCLPATYDGRPSGVTDFVAFEPTVQVDGITFNVKVPTPAAGYYTITGMYLGGSGVDNTHLDKKRLPDNVCSIKNIRVNSPLDIKFNPVTNGRSYASVTNVPALARHNKFDFIVENWTATRYYTPENYNDGTLFGLQTFQFSGTSNIEQNYTIRNCDWINVLYKTPDKCNVTFDGGKTLGVRAAGFINQPVVNVTTSLITYKGGVNLVDPDTQVGGTPIKMPIAVESAIFRHGSYFTGIEPASLQTMGGNKFNSQVVLMVAASAIVDKSSSANEVTSNTLLNDATYGKSHSDYYEEQETYTGTLTLTGGVTVDVVRGRIVSSTP